MKSMRKKIQSSMLLVVLTTLAIAYAITLFFVYGRVRTLAEEDVRYETEYLAAALNISGEGFLQEMDAVEPGSRLTLIDTDGTVLYDSEEHGEPLENHGDRPEVRAAFEHGIGQDARRSDTLRQDMFYCAERLSDGKVIRISKPVRSVLFTALEILPVMLLIGALMLAFAAYVANRQAEHLVEPINHLDLDDPLNNNDTYEELTPLLHRIDEQNRAKDALADMRKEFSANVSHELKTPLTSISGYAEIIRDGLVKPEDISNFSDRIYKEANRLVNLINDIMKLSRLDENKIGLDWENVNLYALAREVIQRLGPRATEFDVRVTLSGEDCTIRGIRQVLDEMIYNIVENAIKYNKKGGSVEVWVGKDISGKKLVVSDTGIGIPEAEQNRIFERFYRVDKSRSKERGGTGLGLSIVKHGIELHHARISLHSELGVGTTIGIIFNEDV